MGTTNPRLVSGIHRTHPLYELYTGIKNNLLIGKTPVKNPVAIHVGGQPGSGKTRLIEIAQTFFPDENVIVLDNDSWFQTLTGCPKVVVYGKKEHVPWWRHIQALRTMAVKDLTAHNFNMLVHWTMGNNEVCHRIKEQKLRGYKPAIIAIACSLFESRLSEIDRLTKDLVENRHTRFFKRPIYDQVYYGLATTLTQLETERYVDDIIICDRTRVYTELYYKDKFDQKYVSNQLRIKRCQTAAQVLKAVCESQWNTSKIDEYTKNCGAITEQMHNCYVNGFIEAAGLTETDYAEIILELQTLPHEVVTSLNSNSQNNSF